MLFNSMEYIVLLMATLACYWLCPWLRGRQWVVLIGSLYFYCSWSNVFGLMLAGVIAVNWLIAGRIAQTRERYWLVLACVGNLLLLCYFKYMNFFLENVQAIGELYDPNYEIGLLKIILPLGISFYVFELISYHVDVYKGKFEHERDPAVFAIFVLFFPHLIAGPICRAAQFMPQIKIKQVFDLSHVYNGVYYFIAGLALKCGIADGLAPFVNIVFKAPDHYSGFDNLMAVIGFGVQILCDFWGYSLMALGAALMFGYVLPYNFNAPYSSLSIKEFWRRWHITLSNWLRDYLYIALGGSRTSAAWKTQRNLFLTMLLGGLWHGASWNFIIWGGLHGAALVIQRSFENIHPGALIKKIVGLPGVAWFLTMFVVFFAWVFFRASDTHSAFTIIAKVLTFDAAWAQTKIAPLFFELLLLYLPLQWLVHKTTYQSDITNFRAVGAAITFTALALFSFIYYVDGNDFIYFQF
ncbi:MBOAT family O-acyltransferase [Pseudomonas viridiflava]|uniref:MBOAT family O-acyltransferase n=1 Tax=Pseudomonas viridiflava TaxID=33069 RepID=UPI001780109E|nr:MBOAT family protein [Pseudomonas viridiflava]MBD8204486.1 MBOAT family protein [Pseudomonas viridiflava]